ncbi:sigma-54-dependent transcriptional regulator [Pirellulaceae bacterium SH449]
MQPSSLSVLFVDDDTSIQEVMRLEIPQMGHAVTVCPDGFTAIAAMERNVFDCMIVDLDMPGMNGIQVIERASQIQPKMDCIVLTGKQTLESAVAALKFGVIDYLGKPCKLRELSDLFDRVAARRELKRLTTESEKVKRKASGQGTVLIGNCDEMKQIEQLIGRVARTNSSVLIRGETGCGKELVARSVHERSLRASKNFVAVNCGALPEHLIESELFGHKKGAFTGADSNRDGLFHEAHGGTIFLDEIGELPLSMQAKLLRVLESGDLRRVGDNEIRQVDVRVVCATHRNLEQMVADQTFREDLLFRINTFEIGVPALRERGQDVLEIARHMYLRHRPEHASIEQIFAPETIQAFEEHSWPGNVRELSNVIEYATILCDFPPIELSHLPKHFKDRLPRREPKPAILPMTNSPMTLKDLEVIAVQEAISRHNGNKPAAAEELGISLKTLYNKLNQAEPSRRWAS